MLGTIVNTACIVVGTLLGTLFKKGLGEKYTKTLFNAMGLASLALGANSFVANMPKSEFPVLFILSLAIGGLIGTALDLDGRVKRVLAKKGGDSFAKGLISACLLYCIGTFSAGGQYLPVHEFHAGSGDIDRFRHHLRHRHDPGRAHPFLLAGVYLAGGDPGLLLPHFPGHAGQ